MHKKHIPTHDKFSRWYCCTQSQNGGRFLIADESDEIDGEAPDWVTAFGILTDTINILQEDNRSARWDKIRLLGY